MIVTSGIHRSPLSRVCALACLVIAVLASSASAAFAVDSMFTINGGGWGHGIGLSQYGAKGYALRGGAYTYDWILNHYYHDTKLKLMPSVTVRVNLDDGAGSRSSWQVMSGTSTGLTVCQTTDTAVKASLTATARYWIVTSNSNTAVHNDVAYSYKVNGVTYVGHKPGARIKAFAGACNVTSGGRVKMLTASGPFNHTSVVWRGYIRFTPNTSSTSKAVNYVPIEHYVYGVVPRESPSSWPAEALKAQAVAARSYAYQDAKEGRTLYCTTQSQVYNGYSGEAASTNAAVDATKGQVVWYGTMTEPVKTYFSSSSGGRTASIQDVWLSATPRPYYTSVADADGPASGNPNYTWSAGPWSASLLGSKIRDFDNGASDTDPLDYSAPYPHKVLSMTAEKASSGFVQYVTIRWSNGSAYRIKASTLRQALELKSTKFSVVVTNPTVYRYQQTSSNFAWRGAWKTGTSSVLSGGSMAYSSTASSKFIATFQGPYFAWVGNRAPSYGIAKVYVDGKLAATVDLYSGTRRYQQALYAKNDMLDTTHTVEILVTGAKNSRSTGRTVAVDRFDIIGTMSKAATPITRVEENAANIAWFGPWSSQESTPLSGVPPMQAYTNSPDASMTVRFIGSGIRWIGSAYKHYGAALVSIDGGSPQEVVLTTSTAIYQKIKWSVAGLAPDIHTLRIAVIGPSSGGSGYVSVDRFDIVGGWLLPPVLPGRLIQSSSSVVARSAGWQSGSSALMSGGSHLFSATAGTTATLTVDGNSISWIAAKNPGYGKAEVWIDGSKAATVDLYSPTRLYQQVVWRSATLPSRRHTVSIRVLHSRNTASSGYWVSLDAFGIYGNVVTP